MSTESKSKDFQLGEMKANLEILIKGQDELKRIAANLEKNQKKEIDVLHKKIDELEKENNTIKSKLDLVVGNVRAFGIGMGAAFTLMGGVIGFGVKELLGLLK